MYEGEVTELTPCETENPMGGYGKTISHVIIGLKTGKGTKQLKVSLGAPKTLVPHSLLFTPVPLLRVSRLELVLDNMDKISVVIDLCSIRSAPICCENYQSIQNHVVKSDIHLHPTQSNVFTRANPKMKYILIKCNLLPFRPEL